MSTRTVQGTLVKPDGTPIVNGEVSFRLQAGHTDDATKVVLSQTCLVNTDATGAFSIALHAGANVMYLCTLPSLERFTFALLPGASPLDIVSVR